MKYFFTLFITLLIGNCPVFSQSKPVTHKVEKGETISQIAQKYQVTPYDIYQLNPDAQSGLKPNSILLIAKQSSMKTSVSNGVSKSATADRVHKRNRSNLGNSVSKVQKLWQLVHL
jgi:LysM repeat protein